MRFHIYIGFGSTGDEKTIKIYSLGSINIEISCQIAYLDQSCIIFQLKAQFNTSHSKFLSESIKVSNFT